MLKTKYLPMLGRFVHVSFTYKPRPESESKFIDAYGFITKVENKYLGFKDNDNYEYIIELNKIYECTLAGKRRTVHQYQQELRKKYKKQLYSITKI